MGKMNKHKCITVAILLICILSFVAVPAMAAPSDRVITPAQKAAEKLQELNERKVFEQRATHSQADFTNVVPGVGGLKYKAEQVPPGFEHIPETVTMVSWHDKGRLHIRDIEHKTTTIQVPWTTLQDVEGFDGEHVRVWHYNDAGVCDGKWVQTVSNEGGYAYLEEVPFSEIIVGGFTGTYSKVESEIDITDTINLGRTFDSDEVSAVTLTIDDQYSTKTGPYDIDTTGLVFWGRFDDAGTTLIDYSGNGNNGTFTASTYTEGKYNTGGSFDGIDDVVEISGFTSNYNELSICLTFNTSAVDAEQYIFSMSNPQMNIAIPYGTTKKIRTAFLTDNEGWHFASLGNTEIASDTIYDVVITYSDSSLKYYINGELDKEDTITTTGPLNGAVDTMSIGNAGGSFYSGMMDEVLIYNKTLTPEDTKELHYIKASYIQAKTNSNGTYSTEWNSSTDNPLSVPFGASESISSISFAKPESIEQNGITIYNPINILMDVTATVGYTEDTYFIEEFCDEGFYIDQYAVEISHTPSADNANGLITYNPTDSLCNEIMSETWTRHLVTNNPAASITTFNQNGLVIDTGAITAGTEYTYVVTAETSVGTPKTRSSSIIMDGVVMAALIPLVSILSLIMGVVNGKTDGELDIKKAVVTAGASFVTIAILVVVVNAVMNVGVV